MNEISIKRYNPENKLYFRG